jgi:hypothetical protein
MKYKSCLRRYVCIGIALSLRKVSQMGRGMKLLVKKSVKWGENLQYDRTPIYSVNYWQTLTAASNLFPNFTTRWRILFCEYCLYSQSEMGITGRKCLISKVYALYIALLFKNN